jgi:hypothetical protein
MLRRHGKKQMQTLMLRVTRQHNTAVNKVLMDFVAKGTTPDRLSLQREPGKSDVLVCVDGVPVTRVLVEFGEGLVSVRIEPANAVNAEQSRATRDSRDFGSSHDRASTRESEKVGP